MLQGLQYPYPYPSIIIHIIRSTVLLKSKNSKISITPYVDITLKNVEEPVQKKTGPWS